MGSALNGSFALQCFKHGNAVELHNGIMFNFYPGLLHTHYVVCLHIVFNPDSKVYIHIPQEKFVQSQVCYDGYKGG